MYMQDEEALDLVDCIDGRHIDIVTFKKCETKRTADSWSLVYGFVPFWVDLV